MEFEPIRVIEFDFSTRTDRRITIDDVSDARAKGLCCWIDMDLTAPNLGARQESDQCSQPRDILKQLGVNSIVVDGVIASETAGRYAFYEDCVHVRVTEPISNADSLEFAHVDMIFGDRLVVTLHRGPVEFLTRAALNYRSFFQEFAETLGFLVFEFWDGLIDSYQTAFRRLEMDVESVRETIFDDAIFGHVSDITRDLLRLRRNVIADRDSLRQLSIHKTGFVSKTTQPYLAKMVDTLERLGGDISIEREILTETLTLYLGIVTHRTNRIVGRLTVISVIFLPLTFLVGLYGMNFESQPEFSWSYGYAFFWIVAGLIFVGTVVFIRVKHWL